MSQLAGDLGVDVGQAVATVQGMLAQGRIRVADDGAVVGAYGLSVTPDRHELWVGERLFWTWCAMDAVGILAALGRSGLVRSRSPLSGAAVEVRFTDGRPEATPAVVFIAELDGCASIYHDYCSQLNIFEDAATAAAWKRCSGAAGNWVSLHRLAASAGEHWRVAAEGLA